MSLGIKPLNKLIDQVFGKNLDVKREAKLMLVVVHMISKAARFKYIQNMVLKSFTQFYNSYPKALKLEGKWQSITKEIRKSNNGRLSSELDLVDAKGEPWKVTLVKDITGDMNLFKYEGN